MSIYIRLFWEFFKTGLFAIGGGMATLPFLKNIGAVTGCVPGPGRRARCSRSRSCCSHT